MTCFKRITGILVLFIIGLHANAQNERLSVTPVIGLTTPFLDNGIGFHFGINPAFTVTEHLSIAGQVSYAFTKISSTFLSGNTGSQASLLALAGGRLYLNSDKHPTRFYLSYLIGGMYRIEEINGRNKDSDFEVGISAGFFVEWEKICLGFSGESSQDLILKLGYIF